MSIITVGIDLAKNVFAVHGVDDNGKAVWVKPKVAREHLLPLIAQLPCCVIGMEARSGAHHWARLFRQHGHTVKLMAPKFVTPYRMSGKRGKNDAADAATSRSTGRTCRAMPTSASAICWRTPMRSTSGSTSTTGSSPRPHGTMRAANG